jgi:hypothetical protein
VWMLLQQFGCSLAFSGAHVSPGELGHDFMAGVIPCECSRQRQTQEPKYDQGSFHSLRMSWSTALFSATTSPNCG